MTSNRLAPLASLALALFLITNAVRAQITCPNFGAQRVPGFLAPAPVTLGCPGAPQWPIWHTVIPPHHAPAPKRGYRPGNARPVPVHVVQYACTGLLLMPVQIVGVQVSGYVVWQPDFPCA